MKVKSSVSLTAVLNLTMDKAPTRPKDNAKEDLIIVIINVIIKLIIIIEFEN